MFIEENLKKKIPQSTNILKNINNHTIQDTLLAFSVYFLQVSFFTVIVMELKS